MSSNPNNGAHWQEVAKRAHGIWQLRNSGNQNQDWLTAETEIRQLQIADQHVKQLQEAITNGQASLLVRRLSNTESNHFFTLAFVFRHKVIGREGILHAGAITGTNGLVESGSFPLVFASLNDLTLDYVLTRLIEYQHRDIQRTEQCMAELAGDPVASSLAGEILGSERAHLEILTESLLPSGPNPNDDTLHTQAAGSTE